MPSVNVCAHSQRRQRQQIERNKKQKQRKKNRFLNIRVNRKFCGFSVYVLLNSPNLQTHEKKERIHRKCDAIRWERTMNEKNIWRIICNKQQQQQQSEQQHQEPTRPHVCVCEWVSECRSFKDWLRPHQFAALFGARNDDIWVSVEYAFFFALSLPLSVSVGSVYSRLLKMMIIILRRSYSVLFFSAALRRGCCDARCNIYIAFCF